MLKATGLLLAILVLLAGSSRLRAQDNVITVIAYDSFAYTEAVMQAFEQTTGYRVEVLRLGDAGNLVNQSVLSRENPLGDVMFGVDNTFLSRALENDLFLPYQSPVLAEISDMFEVDAEYRVVPVDYGDVCLNYDRAYFEGNALAVPSSLIELTQPEYAGLLAVQNPATSSPGLAFLLTSIAVFGETGEYTYLDFWADLVANDVVITDDWTSAYYGEFSGAGGSEGTRPLVVSYASSPVAEVFFSETPVDTAPTVAIIADETCFRQIEYAGILQGTDNEAGAQLLLDFLLSTAFQEDMPLNMFVFPVNDNAIIPDVFVDYAEVPSNPVMMESTEIDDNRERWLEAWIETVLQ